MAGNELATAYLTLVPSLKGAKNTIERELNSANLTAVGVKEGEKIGDGLSSGAGSKLKSGLKVAGAAAGALALAAFSAAFNVGKQSLGAYAEYEQLVGGVDTLFKESSAQLQQYASDAYRTAGLSANKYMEMSTSFAASLISSLDGDTAKAAEYANRAIIDMSDNANKMGTDISMIQNAYQGFAKQNYTMLDNLKLGYGGTKTEMERLLADAEKISGIDYDISSYSDIVDAIHVIQDEMGIAGATYEEAEGTITGSIGMAKAAWDNWLAGLADSDSDMRTLTENLFGAAGTAAENVMPRIKEITLTLLDVLGDVTGDMLLKGRDWMIGLGAGIKDGFGFVKSEIGRGISEGVQRIRDRINDFIQAGKDLIAGLVNGIKAKQAGATDAIGEVGNALLSKTQTVLDIHSPSRKFMEIGQYAVDGLALGINNRAASAANAIGGVSRGMLGAASFSPAQLAGAGTINIYIDGAQVNSDSAIEGSFYNFMTELQRLGVMQGGK